MLIVFFSLLTTVLITSKQARTGATKNTFLFRNGKASHSQREHSPGVSCPPEKKAYKPIKKNEPTSTAVGSSTGIKLLRPLKQSLFIHR